MLHHFASHLLISRHAELIWLSILKLWHTTIERYSTVAQDSDENLQPTDKSVQFIKDNMDYDMETFDGYVSFPKMRIVATITSSIAEVKSIFVWQWHQKNFTAGRTQNIRYFVFQHYGKLLYPT